VRPTTSTPCSRVGRRSEMLLLQIAKRAVKLAVTDIVTTGEVCLQGGLRMPFARLAAVV
jgi:hypothetical protein